jgi:bifunctional DNA-binding transcriptional regulator/antitoxin component of YhaV-PrlF toxin-antitoxin module
MVESNTKLGQSGGIIIPTEYRRKTSLEAGDEVIMHLDEDGLHLYTPAQAIARAQALVRRYIPEGRSLSEELVSKRREEATRW